MDVDEIRKLYYVDHLSSAEIGKRLGKTVWQVLKFMKKNGLKRRKCNESLTFVFNRKPKSYDKKKVLTASEQELMSAGLMIYWGEGAKSEGTKVDLANNDPAMAQVFLTMLRRVYRVRESRLRLLLYCYANQNVENLINFWSKLLKIPTHQFIKPYVRKDFKPEKVNKMPHGVIHVRYCDKKLLGEISQDIAIRAMSLLSP
jgi:hypothetical protein